MQAGAVLSDHGLTVICPDCNLLRRFDASMLPFVQAAWSQNLANSKFASTPSPLTYFSPNRYCAMGDPSAALSCRNFIVAAEALVLGFVILDEATGFVLA